MSHATVLIISRKNDTETIERMMYPYWELDLELEEMKKDPRAKFIVEYTAKDLPIKFQEWQDKQKERIQKCLNEIEKKEFIEEELEFSDNNEEKLIENRYNEIKRLKDNLKKFDISQKWVKDYEGYDYDKKENGYGRYDNPNDKWDWYQIGGRWAGQLKLKNNKQGTIGQKSFMIADNPYKEGDVDSAKIKNIDPDCLKKLTTFAVLNEQGWYEKSRLIWFGCATYEKYCCVVESLTLKDIIRHFKYDYFGIGKKTYKGYSNEYVDLFIKTLYNHYDKKGKTFTLKNNLGNGKTEVTDDLKKCEFFRNQHWNKNFYDRFIKNLDQEMYLTIIDYHI